MSRIAAWIAWSLWALCGTLAVLAVLLDFYTPPVPARHGLNFDVLAAVPLLVYPTVGAFLVSHRPNNPVGWILCAMGVFSCPEGQEEAQSSCSRIWARQVSLRRSIHRSG
jgi:hypothetical protein